MPDTPAPLPTSPELEETRSELMGEMLAPILERYGNPPHPAEQRKADRDRGIAVGLVADFEAAVRAATLAHLAAQAPEGIRELLDAFRGEVLATFSGHVWKGSTPPAESALLAAFTALRGEVDHWKAEATVREERSEMWRTQYNNLRAATAANADHWDATEAALRQSLDAAVERAEAAEALARAAEGYIAVAVGDQDATAASLDAWRTYQHVKAALAPRGASDGSGPADREGR